MLFEITMLVKLDLQANFIASDSTEKSLEDIVADTIYDLDDIEILEIEVKELKDAKQS
jgi:hypothetical protein